MSRSSLVSKPIRCSYSVLILFFYVEVLFGLQAYQGVCACVCMCVIATSLQSTTQKQISPHACNEQLASSRHPAPAATHTHTRKSNGNTHTHTHLMSTPTNTLHTNTILRYLEAKEPLDVQKARHSSRPFPHPPPSLSTRTHSHT